MRPPAALVDAYTDIAKVHDTSEIDWVRAVMRNPDAAMLGGSVQAGSPPWYVGSYRMISRLI